MGSAVESNRRRRRTFWLFGLLVGLPVVLVIGWSVLHFGLSVLFSEFEGPPSLEAEEAGIVVLGADEPVAVRRIVVEAMYPVPLHESLEPGADLSIVLPGWVPQPEGVEDVRHMIVREADGQVLGGDHRFFDDLRCPTPPCTASYLVVFRLMEGAAVGSAEFDWRASARLTLLSEDTEGADLQMTVEEMPVDDVRFISLGPAEEFSLDPSAPLLARHVVVRVGSDVVPESGFNHWPVFADLDDEPTALNPNPDNSWFRPMIRRIQPDLSGVSPWSICQPGLPCEFEYTAVIFYNDGPTHIDSGIESNPENLEVAWRPGILLDFLDGNPPTSSEVAVVSVDHVTLPGGFLTHRVGGEVELGQAGGIQYRTIEITFELPEVSPVELPVLLGGLVTARAHRADGSSRTPPFFFQVGGEGMMVNGGGRLISDGVTAYTMAIPSSRCLPGSSCTLTFEVATRKDDPGDPDLVVVWSLDLHVGFFDVSRPPEGVIFDSEVTETVEP